MSDFKRIWTNGCFDILHAGHIEMLLHARLLGDVLVVGIDSDERVRQLKGEGRPANKQDHRKKVLEAIRYVDEVVIFDSKEEMEEILRRKKVDVIVVGEEYRGKEVTGSSICEVVYFPKVDNLSTTSILSQLGSR